MERAYKSLEYVKGAMDVLTLLENHDLIVLPSEFKNILSLASFEFSRGHYKSCIRICNRFIPEIRRYTKENSKNLKDRLTKY